MTLDKHDVIVIGGGHNGLIVAAYLAKAGLDVCILEAHSKVGGGVITSEVILPGFRFDLASSVHYMIQGNPLIRDDELGLKSRYGLKYINPDRVAAFVFPDDSALVFYRDINKTCQSIARFSRRDAEAYPDFCRASAQIFKAGRMAMRAAPPPMGRLVSFLDGSEEGQEYWRVFLSSCKDVVEEWFESEQMKAATYRFATDYMISPRVYETGLSAFSSLAYIQNQGLALPVGGSGALSEALASCVRDNGGTIRVSTRVMAIKTEDGEAKGVVLDSGQEIKAAKAIVSNVNVKQLFLEMLRPDDLPTGFQKKVKRLRHSQYSYFNYHVALNEPPKYKAGGDVDGISIVAIVPFAEELLRLLDDCTYGVPTAGTPFVVVSSLEDSTRAPKGKHTMSLFHPAPYNLKEGGPARWDEVKQEVGSRILEVVKQHTTNLGSENILAGSVMSPLDLERYNPAMIEGDITHIAHVLSQNFSHRPLPGWGQYRTPLKKLYMCGASTHPGGGVTGSGRIAVQAVMEDLGMDFGKLVAK